MKILVPVDGSKYSMEGVKIALDYAKTKGAEITLVTVTPFISGLDLEISAKEIESINETMKRTGEEVLEKAKNILNSEGISAKTILSSAVSAADEILNIAEKENAALIIIGNRGLGSSAARFLMGSVASKVATNAPCSVYVVKTS
ncbi:MAG: universal stress protein [Nitrospirae bacterium]|jgi:nucleotide-binding universal stress UspA family protein|nr:universal stress protein [Nitrospirota bacterium]